MESKKVELTETESRMVAASDWDRVGKWGDVGQRVQTSIYKTNKLWESKNVQHSYYS